MTASPESLKDLMTPVLLKAGATFDPDYASGAMAFHLDGRDFLVFVVQLDDLDPTRVEVTYLEDEVDPRTAKAMAMAEEYEEEQA